ncbi:hypothetical protein Sjap_005324 [Stephania japonica]|uniref:F-box/LRR-repeat protein 15-like leucin rich repeat domain-containing protein n=1 Tax=Stephania japonica TaxID=461633 RepID=A0AAP0PLR3_9MAGN
MEIQSPPLDLDDMDGLIGLCIDAATKNFESVEKWRRQRRTLERLPTHLGEAVLQRLLARKLVYPSLLEVFRHCVGSINLRGENLVDAEWMAYLGAYRYLHSINVSGCRGINNSTLWALTGMDTLKEVDISRCSKLTDAGIVHLLSISKLEKLFVSQTGLTEKGIIQLSSLRKLSVLDLGGLPVTDLALSSLQVLTKLEYLDIWGSKISDGGAAVLKTFSKLNFLNVAWTNVTKVPYLPNLTCLNMSNCTIHSIFEGIADGEERPHLRKLLLSAATLSDIDEAFLHVEPRHISFLNVSQSTLEEFEFLGNMAALEHLDLSFTRIRDDNISPILLLGESLRYLNLSNTRLTSTGLGLLVGNLPHIESLLLSHTGVDDSALSYTSTMESLKVLDLSNTSIKGLHYIVGHSPDQILTLVELQNLKHLERLDLEETQIRDEAMQPLFGLLGLKSLSLKSDFLSDISLHASSSLLNLKFLGIRGAVLTDAGLQTFNPPPMLEILDLRNCWLVTADGLLSFCERHPKIEVKHEHCQRPVQDHGASGHFSAAGTSATGTSKAMQLRPKKTNTPCSARKECFVDERLRYTREELLELQFSPLSCALPSNNGAVMQQPKT